MSMKRSDLVFAALKVPIDFSMLIAAGLAAYFLRFQGMRQFRPVLFEIPIDQFIVYEAASALFFLCLFAGAGLYSIVGLRIRNEVQKIFSACSTGIMGIIVLLFFVQELFSSRFIILAAWIFSFLFVVFGRVILRMIRNGLHARGIGCHGIVVVGDLAKGERLANELRARPELGYRLLRLFLDFGPETRAVCDQLASDRQLDEIFVLNAKIVQEEFSSLSECMTLSHVSLRYSADIVGGKNLLLSTFFGIPCVEIKKTQLDGWGKIVKRAGDVCGSLVLILITSPLMIVIALLIRLESKGSPIYVNERVGEDGRLFPTLKFRSMYKEYCTGKQWDPTGAATTYELNLAKTSSIRKGPVFKVLNDPRRTRVGRFLERFSLDELPQLFNVLLGTMSLVGPRPHMPIQVQNYQTHHHDLFSIKPGITGMAQIEGRSDLDFEDEVSLDRFYIEHWSLKLDFVILAKTPWAVIARKSRV